LSNNSFDIVEDAKMTESMTPLVQGAEEAVERLTNLCGADWPDSMRLYEDDPATHGDLRALLTSHATLKSENEQLRGKVGELRSQAAEKIVHDYAREQVIEAMQFVGFAPGHGFILSDTLAEFKAIGRDLRERAEAAEAQLATARRALEPFAAFRENGPTNEDRRDIPDSAFNAAKAFLASP
jgi:hypothetical protein